MRAQLLWTELAAPVKGWGVPVAAPVFVAVAELPPDPTTGSVALDMVALRTMLEPVPIDAIGSSTLEVKFAMMVMGAVTTAEGVDTEIGDGNGTGVTTAEDATTEDATTEEATTEEATTEEATTEEATTEDATTEEATTEEATPPVMGNWPE